VLFAIQNKFQQTPQQTFLHCYKLKTIPDLSWWSVVTNSSQYGLLNFSQGFGQDYSLTSLNLPLYRGYSSQQVAPITANMFGTAGANLYCIKDITFLMENNAPVVREYKSQNFKVFADYGVTPVGFSKDTYFDTTKEVTDAASYEALKNEDWWFTTLPEYSRYNHDSAVNTINSLPDTSAYIATAGGTNTITFENATNKGSATDGGAIADLTAAEIAVATAKGWTVSLT